MKPHISEVPSVMETPMPGFEKARDMGMSRTMALQVLGVVPALALVLDPTYGARLVLGQERGLYKNDVF